MSRRRRRNSKAVNCAICKKPAGEPPGDYPGYVCKKCDARAVNAKGKRPFHGGDDDGDNPVFIDGIECVRHYKFGGWVTMSVEAGGFLAGDFFGF